MKSTVMLGIALIVLGVIGLIVQGVSYTSREKVVDLGGLTVTADRQKTIPIPAILGGVALAGGVALIVMGARKST